MGCKPIYVNEKRLFWNEGDDDWGCACTFPHNDAIERRLCVERVATLALIGAAAVLAHRDGEIETDDSLPGAVPDWIKAEIRRHLPQRAYQD